MSGNYKCSSSELCLLEYVGIYTCFYLKAAFFSLLISSLDILTVVWFYLPSLPRWFICLLF